MREWADARSALIGLEIRQETPAGRRWAASSERRYLACVPRRLHIKRHHYLGDSLVRVIMLIIGGKRLTLIPPPYIYIHILFTRSPAQHANDYQRGRGCKATGSIPGAAAVHHEKRGKEPNERREQRCRIERQTEDLSQSGLMSCSFI